MSGGLQPHTIVVCPGARLAEIVKRSAHGRARGYDVQPADQLFDRTQGTLPHFMDEGSVRPAVVGVTVCPRPRGSGCYCGMVHATAPMLARLAGT